MNKGASVRIRVPGPMVEVATRPFPFPGIDSSVKIAADSAVFKPSSPFLIVEILGEAEASPLRAPGAILNVKRG